MLTEVAEGRALCCYGEPAEFTKDWYLEYYFTLMIQGVVYRVGLNWEAIASVKEEQIDERDLQDLRVDILRMTYNMHLLCVAIVERFINDKALEHEIIFQNFEYVR